MIITAREFFDVYYELERGLIYLQLQGIMPEDSINYLAELRQTKRKLKPYFTEGRLDENSPLIMPDRVHCKIAEIEKFIQAELGKIELEIAEVGE